MLSLVCARRATWKMRTRMVRGQTHRPCSTRFVKSVMAERAPAHKFLTLPAFTVVRRGRAMPRSRAPWPLENNHLHRRAAPRRHRRAHGPGWPDERRGLSRLCRTGARPRVAAGRGRHHGQSACPQSPWRPTGHRSRRRKPALPAALQPRLQSHRNGLRQAQGPFCAPPPPEQSPTSGKPSPTPFAASRPTNAQTISPRQPTMRYEWKLA